MLPGLDFPIGALAGFSPVLVASAVDTTARLGSYTFGGLSFGPDFTGRTLIAVAALVSSSNQRLDQSTVTIGGSGTVGDDNGDLANTDGSEARQGAAGVGVWANQATGTSGAVVVNFGPGSASAAAVFLFSVPGLASSSPADSTSALVSPINGAASSSDTVNIPAGGLLVGGIMRANNTNAITLSGVSEVTSLQQTIGGAHRVAVGLSVQMSAQTGRSVGFTSTGTSIFGGRFSAFA